MPIVAPVTKRAATATSARVDRRPRFDAACRAARTPHRGPDVRRHPARRVRARPTVELPGRSTAPTARRARPTPTRSRAVAEARRRGASRPVLDRRRRRVLGRGRGRRCARSSRGARSRRSSTAWAAGTLPADHELAFSRGAVGRAEGSRPRARRGHAARLPARLRPRSATRRSCTSCDARDRRSRAHADLAASTAGDLARDVRARWPRRARRRRDARRLGRRGCATTSSAKRAAEAPRLAADADADQARRASTASCASGSTATRS